MIIGHASDLHGDYSDFFGSTEVPDVWVFSGDMFPNLTRGDASVERSFQEAWFHERAAAFVGRLGGRPVVSVSGNHCYINLARLLRDLGVEAHAVTPTGVDVLGLRFSGFREIPWIAGEWAGEIHDFTQLVEDTFASNPDILVTHAPAAGLLDRVSGGGYGIQPLATALAYRPHNIRAHFFGHSHPQGGEDTVEMGVHFFNGATKVRFVAVETE